MMIVAMIVMHVHEMSMWYDGDGHGDDGDAYDEMSMCMRCLLCTSVEPSKTYYDGVQGSPNVILE